MKFRMHCFSIILGSALIFTGCTLEEPVIVTKCPGPEGNGTLSYIRTKDGTCHVEDCTSADNCCGIENKSERKLVWDSFKNSQCPHDSTFPECHHNGAMFFCSSGCLDGNEFCKGECINLQAIHIQSCENDVIKCKDNYIDCDGDVRNGCELSTTFHVNSCDNGKFNCIDGYEDCDGIIENGCETNLQNDRDNCGECKAKCNKVCSKGQCVVSCSEGENLCNGKCISMSMSHFERCEENSDSFVCKEPYMSCDNNYDTGCETNLQTDPNHCGNCNNVCKDERPCIGGQCSTIECPTDKPKLCITETNDTECRNVNLNDANECGDCNYRCADHPILNASSNTCRNGECIYDCDQGFVNVGDDRNATQLNCIDPNTNPNYCGATDSDKGKVCKTNEKCLLGKCTIDNCESPETLCTVNGVNKCINIKGNDTDHCGGCDLKCNEFAPSGTATRICDAGVCTYSCPADRVNVGDGITANTIKCVNPMTDHDYCGADGNAYGKASSYQKGKRCEPDESCDAAKCVKESCPESTPTECKTSNGLVCVNTKTDPDHCGECNSACSSNIPENAKPNGCSAGECQYKCIEGYQNCNSGQDFDSIICADLNTSMTNCGKCNNLCAPGQRCIAGVCNKYPILTYLLDKDYNDARCDNVSHFCSEMSDYTEVCTNGKNSSCFSFEKNTNFDCTDTSYQGIYFKIYSVYEASNGAIAFYEQNQLPARQAFNKLISTSCPKDISQYTESELYMGENSCNAASIVCTYNKISKKFHKFTVVISNEDKMLYWMPVD